jgi:hypothetical protein
MDVWVSAIDDLFIVLDSTTCSVFPCKFLGYPGETEFSACRVPKYASIEIAQNEAGKNEDQRELF